MGTTLTEHTGHPKLCLSDPYERVFTGGYDWYTPDNEEQLRNALENLRHMQFEPWIPSIAESGFKHFRYLFDISQTSSAFRLPIPIASEFPGIETIQYQSKAAPSDLPARGLFLGEHLYFHKRRKVFFKKEDRRRHAYVVGQTGGLMFEMYMRNSLQLKMLEPCDGKLSRPVLRGERDRKVPVLPGLYDIFVCIHIIYMIVCISN